MHLVWTAARGWTAMWLLLLILQGVLPAVPVYLSQPLVDGLVQIIGHSDSRKSIQPVVFVGLAMASALVLTELVQGLLNWVRTAQAELVQDYLSTLIHRQAVAVDFAFYESSDYHDCLERVRNDLNHCPLALLESIGSLFQHAITLGVMGLLLIPYGIWLPAALVISTLPALYIVLRFNGRYHRWWKETTSERRRGGYYDRLLTHSSTAAELRLFNLGMYFQLAYQSVRQRLRAERIHFTKHQSLARLGAAFLGVLMSGTAMAWMVWQALLVLFQINSATWDTSFGASCERHFW